MQSSRLSYHRRTMRHVTEALQFRESPTCKPDNPWVFPLGELPGLTNQMSKTALPRDPLLGLDDGILGRIMVIHTFGDYARFHSHLHAIVANGPFQPNGTFYCLPKRDLKPREGKIKAPEDGPVVMEDFDDGWPGYEEPVLVYH